MTERSLPWDGTVTGDKGPYGAADWQLLYQQILSDQDSVSKRGPVWTDIQDSLDVTEYSTPNMSVDVGPGAALVDGCAYWSDATVNLTIAAADPTLARIDRVVLQLDNTAQTIRLVVKTGSPGASPSPPTLQTDRSPYFEIPLWQVYVAAAVTQIFDANLTDEREMAGVPGSIYIPVTNKSGGTLIKGDVVVWDDANARSIKTTTTPDDPNIAGVVTDTIANNAVGRICVFGIHLVQVQIAVGIGYALGAASSAKSATYNKANVFARALESTTGGGLVTAFVNVKPVYPVSQVISYNNEAAGIALSTKNTWADMSAANLSITLTTHGGLVEVWASFPFSTQYVGGGQFTLDVDFTYDGNRYNNVAHSKVSGIARWQADINYLTTGPRHMMNFGPVRITLNPGSHTFRLQWRMNDAGTQTVYLDGTAIFGAREVIA